MGAFIHGMQPVDVNPDKTTMEQLRNAYKGIGARMGWHGRMSQAFFTLKLLMNRVSVLKC